jgi:hypothetical protein
MLCWLRWRIATMPGGGGVGADTSDPAPSGHVLLNPAAARAAEPSWARVLATTIRLSAARRWRPISLVPALALAAVAVLWFTGILAGSASPGAQIASPGRSPAGGTRASGTSSLDAATAARTRAAGWIASQVSSSAIIACHPDMCAALQAQGVTAGRLMPLPAAAASPLGASVLVTSPSAGGGRLDDEYAPAVIASFGSGETRIDVRAAEPGGPGAYRAALKADLAARRSAGAQLLRNRHIQFTPGDAAQIRAGDVDSRLLATLAALASQRTFRVTAFGDASPGVQVLFRAVTITSAGRGGGSAALAAAADLVRMQAAPYLPAHVTFARLAAGQAALIIEFAAPSPLGLLAAVLR